MVTVLHQATQETVAATETRVITATELIAAQQEIQAITVAQAIPALQVAQAPTEIPEVTGVQARRQPSVTTQTSQAEQQEPLAQEAMLVWQGQVVLVATAELRGIPGTQETPETTVFAAMQATQATLAIRATLETMVFAETVAHEETQAIPAIPDHQEMRATTESEEIEGTVAREAAEATVEGGIHNTATMLAWVLQEVLTATPTPTTMVMVEKMGCWAQQAVVEEEEATMETRATPVTQVLLAT